jgi:S1-C subfamily serine protease
MRMTRVMALLAASVLFSAWCPAFAETIAPAAVASIAPASTGFERHDEKSDWAKILADRSPSLVTVKFVLKIEPGSQEQEAEITGLVIDSAGLILCSNLQTGGFPPIMMQQFGGSFTATPTNIKILAGDDVEGVSAKLIARDSELDLAWIRVDDGTGKTFSPVSFDGTAKPGVGDALLSITRLGKFFDRATVIHQTRLGGITKKPRTLLVPGDNSIANQLGVPIFTSSGQVVGFTALQLPEDEDEGEGGMGGARRAGDQAGVGIRRCGDRLDRHRQARRRR